MFHWHLLHTHNDVPFSRCAYSVWHSAYPSSWWQPLWASFQCPFVTAPFWSLLTPLPDFSSKCWDFSDLSSLSLLLGKQKGEPDNIGLQSACLRSNPRSNILQLWDPGPQSPHLHSHISLYCTLQIPHFLQLKVCGKPVTSKSMSAIFPTAFAHSLCHILVILATFQAFSLLLYLLRRSLIRDLSCYCSHCFGCMNSTRMRRWI